MKEDLHEPIPVVTSYESTFGRPRFLGVPADDLLIEDSSMEGILHGRTISDVHRSDTQELERAGVSWDEAVATLKCLGVTCLYQNDQIDAVSKRLQQQYFGERSYWDFPEEIRRRYENHVRQELAAHSGLAGFGPYVTSESTGARVQFDNPIRDDRHVGDGTPFDLVAENGPERRIAFDDGTHRFSSVVNFPTLRVAEAYHLLEKGNQYAMTGEQLAALTDVFSREQFDAELGGWLQERMKSITKGMTVVPGHRESLAYADGATVELRVGNFGGVDLILSVEPFCRSYISQEDGQIRTINLNGEDWHKAQTVQYTDGIFKLEALRNYHGDQPEPKPIDPGTDLGFVADTMSKLHDHARSNPDGMLRKYSDSVYLLRRILMDMLV